MRELLDGIPSGPHPEVRSEAQRSLEGRMELIQAKFQTGETR
jgi:hypothetical protein